MRTISRRNCLAILGAAICSPLPCLGADEPLPPVRTITRGPKPHWFGYYDKLQFDPTSRYVLGMEVGFEHRSSEPHESIAVGMVDRHNADRWTELGSSHAWCWQQGCMLQWLPGSKTDIVWNDRADSGEFVCRKMNVVSRELATVPHPIYAVSPDAKIAVAPDFRRLHDTRPGYGYAGPADPCRDEDAPRATGIWRIDLTTGKQQLIISHAQAANLDQLDRTMIGAKHWFNHLLFNPTGSRFVFLHRWRQPNQKGFSTRMLTARPDGSDLFVLDPSGFTSHFIWRDETHLLAWTRPRDQPDGFWLFTDKTTEVARVGAGVMTVNGHCTYLPGNDWILNDTYPDKDRLQHPYLFHVATGRKSPLGHFVSPPEYNGEWRCDTHPRFSPDGKLACIDSPHTGIGRQMHLIDVSTIVARGA